MVVRTFTNPIVVSRTMESHMENMFHFQNIDLENGLASRHGNHSTQRNRQTRFVSW
jgi:hypothetical protein